MDSRLNILRIKSGNWKKKLETKRESKNWRHGSLFYSKKVSYSDQEKRLQTVRLSYIRNESQHCACHMSWPMTDTPSLPFHPACQSIQSRPANPASQHGNTPLEYFFASKTYFQNANKHNNEEEQKVVGRCCGASTYAMSLCAAKTVQPPFSSHVKVKTHHLASPSYINFIGMKDSF